MASTAKDVSKGDKCGVNNEIKSTVISLPVVEEVSNVVHPQEAMKFTDKSIRAAFIRKVYGLVLMQLLITGLVVWAFRTKGGRALMETLIRFIMPFLITWVIFYIILLCVMLAFEKARRKVPYNYLLLLSITLHFSIVVAFACRKYGYGEILSAGGITFAIVLCLTIFAFQTKIDFTEWWSVLLIVVLLLVLYPLAFIYIPHRSGLGLGFSSVAVFIVCCFLVADTQIMIGGDHRYAISPEEYTFAALQIYMDIIYIFMKTLQICH